MEKQEETRKQAGKGLLITALVLLAGIVVLAVGYFSGNRVAFYAGLLITLAGVLIGIQQLVVDKHA